MHDIFFIVEQGNTDLPLAAMVRYWLAVALAFCWGCVECCVHVLWAAPPGKFPRATIQLNPRLEIPMCVELARLAVLKLNRVLQSLCALIIAFLSLFLSLGTRALQNGFQIYL